MYMFVEMTDLEGYDVQAASAPAVGHHTLGSAVTVQVPAKENLYNTSLEKKFPSFAKSPYIRFHSFGAILTQKLIKLQVT